MFLAEAQGFNLHVKVIKINNHLTKIIAGKLHAKTTPAQPVL